MLRLPALPEISPRYSGMMSWLVTPDALPQFHAALTAAVQSGKPWQFRQGLHLLVKILSVLQVSEVIFHHNGGSDGMTC